jgi:hypothetical protein
MRNCSTNEILRIVPNSRSCWDIRVLVSRCVQSGDANRQLGRCSGSVSKLWFSLLLYLRELLSFGYV